MEPIRRKASFALILLVSFGFLSVSIIVAEAGKVFRSINSIRDGSSRYSFVPSADAHGNKERSDVSPEEASEENISDSKTEASEPMANTSDAGNQEEASGNSDEISVPLSYGSVHSNVTATLFWVGEDSSDDNGHISNVPSAWDDEWNKSFGGVDDPKKRHGFLPAKFTPKENTFYCALPYNDFDENGERKKEVATIVPWFHEKSWSENESVCKNRWVKIMKGDKAVYAQWEDVGPFGETDKGYVFGSNKPKSSANEHAGIDLSPAATEYLGLSGEEKVSWQFVAESAVPDGPWKRTVTTSGVRWN